MNPCLNPLIAFDRNKLSIYRKWLKAHHKKNLRSSKLQFNEFWNIFKKDVELKGWFNFNKFCEECGNDFVLDFINNVNYYLLPCRKCSNCQLNRSQQWSIRNSLHSLDYEDCEMLFFTLTYNDEKLEKRLFNFKDNDYILPVLFKPHVQNFVKSIRNHFKIENLKYFACGEYGSRTFRPHYHIIFYGFDKRLIEDLKIEYEKNDNLYYSSEYINLIWGKGNVLISDFSVFTATYVSRYCVKKQNEKDLIVYSNIHYRPFILSSKNLGFNYFKNNVDKIYENDRVVKKVGDFLIDSAPPEYFDRKLKDINYDKYLQVKKNRKKFDNVEYFKNLKTNINYSEYFTNQNNLIVNKFTKRLDF